MAEAGAQRFIKQNHILHLQTSPPVLVTETCNQNARNVVGFGGGSDNDGLKDAFSNFAVLRLMEGVSLGNFSTPPTGQPLSFADTSM